MKNKFTALALTLGMLIVINSTAQQPNFEWAKNFGGTGSCGGEAIATDASGNVYTIGYYNGLIDFDPGPGTYTLNAPSWDNDVFITKMDANGNLVWARSMGGSSTDDGYSIAVDANGNVYACGRFYSTDFDPGSPSYTLSSNGSDDMFICKFNSSGTLQWARSFGSSGFDMAYGITADVNGDVYFTGYFSGTVDFNPATAIYNVTANGINDIFIYKMNSSGNLVWVHTFGDSGNGGLGYRVTTDASGNVYFCGSFSGTIDFNPGPGTNTLSALSPADIFVAKYSSSGAYIWARAFNGNSGAKWIRGIAVDANNNVFTTGSFNTTLDFDPGASTYTLTPTVMDSYVSKLDNNGNFAWAKQIGGIYSDYGTGVATDASGNVYVTGVFSGTVDFNPGPSVYTVAVVGIDDAFVTKLDNAGNFVFAYTFGDVNFDQAYGISVQADNIHLTGLFSGSVDFDPGVGTFSLTSSTSLYDVFVHKMSQCFAPATPSNLTLPANQSACIGSSLTLLAASGTTTINWYGSATSTAAIHSGTFFATSSALAAGTYTYYAEASTCTVSARTPITLTVHPNPVVLASSNTSLICTGETASLSAGGANTYSWNTGASTSVIAISPTVTTTYTVNGTDANNCSGSSTITLNVSDCLGISNHSEFRSSAFSVYPVPNNGQFTVKFDDGGVKEIKIYNSLGAVIESRQSESLTEEFDLGFCSAGIYYVSVSDGKSSGNCKIVIK